MNPDRTASRSNRPVNPPHSAVTARAYCGKPPAAGRAGYAQR